MSTIGDNRVPKKCLLNYSLLFKELRNIPFFYIDAALENDHDYKRLNRACTAIQANIYLHARIEIRKFCTCAH